MYHASDYLTEAFLRFNEMQGASIRYGQTKELLTKHNETISINNFLAMS